MRRWRSCPRLATIGPSRKGIPDYRKTITSTQGESYLNLMESHFNIQRRLYDYQFSLTRTPLEFEQAHQDFMHLYNTTAHQGLLEEQFASPIPLDVLGEATGRLYTPVELERKFARVLFPRITNRYGCVTLHSCHFYVEAGLPMRLLTAVQRPGFQEVKPSRLKSELV